MLTTMADLPSETVVPAAASLLDADRVLSVCRDLWAREGASTRSDWRAARMIEALYHPRRYLRVAYVLLADPETPPPRYWPEGAIVYCHAPARTPVSRRGTIAMIDGQPVEIYRFPNDRRLRGLRLAGGRDSYVRLWMEWEAQRGFRAKLDASSLQRLMVRYVPEQKWIVRLRGDWSGGESADATARRLALRACRPSICATLAQRHRELSGGRRGDGRTFRVPELVGASCEKGLLGVEWIRGLTLVEALREQDAASVMGEVSQRLRALHATNLGGLGRVPGQQLAHRVQCAARDLALAAPHLKATIRPLAERCVGQLDRLDDPIETVTLHNDFHWNQISIKKDRFALFDLDRMARGDALIDVATLAAQLDLLGRRPDVPVSDDESRRWRSAFLQSWANLSGRVMDGGRLHLYCAAARWVLAWGLLRHLRPGWSVFAESCLEQIESDLRLSEAGDWQ